MQHVQWIEAQASSALHSELAVYDHHRFEVDGRAAVLITYVHEANPERGVLAVLHRAATKHPPVPERVRARLAELSWEPSYPPASPS